jgi:hypothetical protein
MSTSVNSVVSFFPSAENGFSTSTVSSTAPGATVVELDSIAGYENGEVVVFVIEPADATKKQTFTGIADTVGVQVTDVVWTAGDNQVHAAGVVVADYASATHISMISKGLTVEHNQNGTHSDITADSVATDTITEDTVNAGVTVEGVVLKDSIITVPTVALTSAWDGMIQYNGKAFYGGIGTSHGVIPVTHFTSTTADFTGTNVNTAQPVFNTTEDVITLAANTSYVMEGVYHIHTTGTTSHTLGILFAGTATLTSIGYLAQTTNAATEVLGAVNSIWSSVATITVLTAATATATHHSIVIKGMVRTNAAGTFIPQYQWSAAPGAAGVTLKNSYLTLTPVGSDTTKAIGAWA